MNELQIFTNEEFGEVRTIEENGQIYFCGSDVAKALGYRDTINAVKQHCKGVVKRHTLTNGGMQEVNFIPEGDLYRLIVNSKLESAEKLMLYSKLHLPTIILHNYTINSQLSQ